MNETEYRELSTAAPTIRVSELEDPTDRVLLNGYTTDRQDFVVALRGGLIHRRIGREVKSAQEWSIADLAPNKRVYSEHTDYAFARLLIQRGARLTLLAPGAWNPHIPEPTTEIAGSHQ